MTDEEKRILSDVRLGKARENLTAGRNLISSGDYRIAATRTYYAIFHAMRAVLALDGIDQKRHSGIISEFRQRYIKTRLIPKSQSDTISKLSNLRTDSDYDDFFIVSKDEVQEALEQAEAFVRIVSDFLAWDPDFTKVTKAEAERIARAEASGYVDGSEIDWNDLSAFA